MRDLTDATQAFVQLRVAAYDAMYRHNIALAELEREFALIFVGVGLGRIQPLGIPGEALGGVEPAHALVRALLARGTPVVTANKSLLAEHASSLHELALESDTCLRYEASVAAGIPVASAS